MEAGMKRWLAVVAGAAAIVALRALPPSSFEMPERDRLPESVRLEAVEGEVRRAHAALRALRWSDSLSQLALRTAVDGLVLSPPRVEGLEPADILSWEEAQRDALGERARRHPYMVVGIFWQPFGQSALPGVPDAARSSDITFVGEHDGTPYCIRAIPYSGPATRALLGLVGDVGACRLYAAYGVPGVEVQAWLEASALGFARIDSPSWAADFARRELVRPEGTLRLFGLGRPQLAYESLVVQACLAGRETACERATTDPGLIAPQWGDRAWLVAHTPATGFGVQRGYPPFGYLDDGLLYEWEAAFGPDAFARFWTSSAPVPEAFEAAFGVPLGAWMLRWVERHSELYRAGPSLPWGSVGWSLLGLAVLAGMSTAAGMRRRVGSG